MGGRQSHEESDERTYPRVVRINRSEIPDEYKEVGISDSVIDRISRWNLSDDATEAEELRRKLEEQQHLNGQLLRKLKYMSYDEQISEEKKMGLSIEELEQRKKAFEEAIERVERQFFSYQRRDACQSEEMEIMQCINEKKSRLLNCATLVHNYGECVKNIRSEMLSKLAEV